MQRPSVPQLDPPRSSSHPVSKHQNDEGENSLLEASQRDLTNQWLTLL